MIRIGRSGGRRHPTFEPAASSVRQAAWIGAALALVALGAGLPGLSEVGVTWDEPRYFQSVERIRGWMATLAAGEIREALEPAAIREAWDSDRYYNPHPPLYKAAMALTATATQDRLGRLAGYRLSSLLMFAALVGLLAGLTARLSSQAAGFAAGLALLTMPRVLGHAHIGATDIPLSLFWFTATTAAFLYVQNGRRRWVLVGGVALGLAFATKFTAFLLPIPLVAWMLIAGRSRRAITVGIYGFALALVVSILVNPAAWPDPIGFQQRLIEESLNREATIAISTFYAGEFYTFFAPWHHMVVMSLATLPLPIVALALLGLGIAVRPGPMRPLALLCVFQCLFWWLLMALPTSPDHDGVRLWLPMFPFVAILAGIGFARLAGAVTFRSGDGGSRVAVAALALLFFAPPAIGTIRVAPYYLSYYGELIGGPAGAADRGMEATYWFDAVTASFRDRLHEALPEGAVVVAYPNAEYYVLLQEMGLIRRDLRFTRAPPADFMLIVARKAMLTGGWDTVYRRTRPLLAAELDGVELVGLYRFNEPAVGPEADAEGESR